MTTLHEIYARLLAHFGPLTGPEARRPWWPLYGDDPAFETIVGAVLVQQTRWETVEAALLRIIAAGLLAPAAMASADPAELALLIRPAAFHTQKAPGLIAIARHICERYGCSAAAMLARPTAELRAELLALPRVGPETCDVIMLYGGGHPVFVVDEYTRRLFERVGADEGTGGQGDKGTREQGDKETGGQGDKETASAASFWRRPYEAVRLTIEQQLSLAPAFESLEALARRLAQLSELPVSPSPGFAVSPPSDPPVPPSPPPPLPPSAPPPVSRSALYAEYHAQINEECVRYCLARPRCDGPPARRVYSLQEGRESYLGSHDGCPLRPICGFYRTFRQD